MKICLEGPSAIGKTTLSQILSEKYFIIPEVNILFKEEKQEGRFWYYEKQVERFQLAESTPEISIFDGDIFQPLWYNWIYNFPSAFPSFEDTYQFYLQKIKENKIAFPDLYIVFETDLDELKRRKEKDKTRRRGNFKKHLKLIEPQKNYFEFLKKETDIQVEFIEYKTVEETKERVLELINSLIYNEINTIRNFEKVVSFLA